MARHLSSFWVKQYRGIGNSEKVVFVAIRKIDGLCCECVVAISNLATVAISLFFACAKSRPPAGSVARVMREISIVSMSNFGPKFY